MGGVLVGIGVVVAVEKKVNKHNTVRETHTLTHTEREIYKVL